MRVRSMPRTASSVSTPEQGAGPVLGGGGERRAVVAGRRGRRAGPAHQREPGDGAGVVGDVVGEHVEPVQLGGQRRGHGGVDLAAGDLGGGLRRRRRHQHLGVGQVLGDPAAGLRDAVRVRRDACARRAAVAPGRTSTANRTATSASRTMTSGGSATSPSRTAGTAPSTVFSIGTQPASTLPSRTAASTAGLPLHGTSSAPSDSGSERSACSVKVARGPRKAMRRGRQADGEGGPGSGLAVSAGQQPEPGQPGAGHRCRIDAAPRAAAAAHAGDGPVGQLAQLRGQRVAASVRAAASPRGDAPVGHGDDEVEEAVRGEAGPSSRDGPSPPAAERGEPAAGSTATCTNLSTSALSGTSTSADRRRAASACSHARRPGARRRATRRCRTRRRHCGRRGSTTATTSSGTNSETRSSQTSSTSGGAAVSTLRGVSRFGRDSTVDSAFGTAPRPVSTTREMSTGRSTRAAGEVGDELRQPRHRADELPHEAAVAAVARDEVALDHVLDQAPPWRVGAAERCRRQGGRTAAGCRSRPYRPPSRTKTLTGRVPAAATDPIWTPRENPKIA